MSPTKPRSNRALPPGKPGNARIALICVGVFALMVGAAFAAVPMYKRFCQLTGYGGTVSRAEAAPGKVLAQTLVVRFDTNVRDLPWVFTPDQVSQTVHIGDTGLAFFKVTNTSDKVLVGRAAYNVAPDQAGRYFRKLECFCFTDQALKPGETMFVRGFGTSSPLGKSIAALEIGPSADKLTRVDAQRDIGQGRNASKTERAVAGFQKRSSGARHDADGLRPGRTREKSGLRVSAGRRIMKRMMMRA